MGEVDSATGRLKNAALWYANNGWKVLPVHGIVDGRCTCGRSHSESKDIGKHPAINSWHTEATSDPDKITAWWDQNPDYNIGVFAKESGFLVIDIDPRNGGDESFLKLEALASGALPKTVEAVTGVYSVNGKSARGRHLIYKCKPGEKFIGNFKKAGLDGIDVKYNGYILVDPSRHFSGVNYYWKDGHAPWQLGEPAVAPEELLAVIRASSPSSNYTGGSSKYKDGNWGAFKNLEHEGSKVDIEKILDEGLVEGERATEIYRLACALANKMGTDPITRSAIESMLIRFNAEKIKPPMELEGPNSLLMHVNRAMDWVAGNPKIDRAWEGISDWAEGAEWAAKTQEAATQKIKNKLAEKAANAVGMEVDLIDYEEPSTIQERVFIGDFVSSRIKQGMSVAEAIGGGDSGLPDDKDAVSAEDGGSIGDRSFTDVGNGRRLIDTFGSSIRYTPGLGWHQWDGSYWKPDEENLRLQELAKRIASVIASEIANVDPSSAKATEIINWAKQAKSSTRMASMLKSAVSDERIIVPIENWDGNKNLLGVMNGVVNLKTGELMSGRPDLHITRRAPVAYTPGLKNIKFEQFLDFATGGDKEFQDWLQRAVGYTLTGLSEQDVLFLVYGPPGSGKTTFVETIFNALGPEQYSWTLDSSVLAAGDGQANRTDEYHMAELRGRRMIWVDELPESERLKENQVKKMTGSGTLSGRSPGERPFTFSSQGKLWITTNHRPIITDDAMWRRLRPIPLTNIPENPDKDLRPYLSDPEGGLPAVLSWAVDGAIKYLNSSAKDSLGWCTVVSNAADIYKKNEDRIGLFFEEETRQGSDLSITIATLYALYRKWSDTRGERALTQIAFQRKLSDRAYKMDGQGAKALLHGYAQLPKAVPDWSSSVANSQVML